MDESHLQQLLDLLQRGDDAAREQLLAMTYSRLQALAAKMFRDFPKLQRHLDTEDVLQAAAIRLDRALQASKPATIQAYYRLAATQIRRELLDLTRHLFGPEGAGKNHGSNAYKDARNQIRWHIEQKAQGHKEPHELAGWTEFHKAIAKLPDKEREVVDLLWYQGLPQAEAAALLKTSLRTIKARWQSARAHLQETLGREPLSLDE